MFRLSVVRRLGFVAMLALILAGVTGDETAAGPPMCNCCSGGNGAGCNCQPCEDIVCDLDPFCCNIAWDSICNGEGEELCTCCTDGCDNGGGEVCDPVTDGDDVPAISNRGIGVAILLLLGASTAVLLWRRRSAT